MHRLAALGILALYLPSAAAVAADWPVNPAPTAAASARATDQPGEKLPVAPTPATPTNQTTPSSDATASPNGYGVSGGWNPESPACPDWLNCNPNPSSTVLRFGWWGVKLTGSPVKVGEYQDLESSPFWDVDGLQTDGYRTLNYFATGLDEEGTQAGLKFYGLRFQGDLGFQRFLRRTEHVPISNFDGDFSSITPSGVDFGPLDTGGGLNTGPGVGGGSLAPGGQRSRPVTGGGAIPATPVPSAHGPTGFKAQDLNVGEDYAIRVEEFNADVATNLTDHVKFRVEAWGMRKFGERQANAMTHCFQMQASGARGCHVLSQEQQIDWVTTQVTPHLEGRFGPVTIEYSRPMRQFTQNDQWVTRSYNGFPPIINGDYPYAVVPDSTTQIDKLKLGVDLTSHTHFYGFGYVGNTEDRFRDVSRTFGGYDLRLTDSTISGLTITGFGRGYSQKGEVPTVLLQDETQFLTPQQIQNVIRHPIDYNRTAGGIDLRWRPNFSEALFHRLAFTAGYEYDQLQRDYVSYLQSSYPTFGFTQPNTITNAFHVGVRQPWSGKVDSFANYKLLFNNNPLYGFSGASGVVNTALPSQQHIVEFGGGWHPTATFGISGREEIDLGHQSADKSIVPGNLIRFSEQNYSSTATVWWAPTSAITVTGSAAFMSNWIYQNITLGDDFIAPGTNQMDNSLLPPITRRWNYGGTANVFTVRTSYRLTDDWLLTGGYEYVRGNDWFGSRGFADLWPDLPLYSSVLVVTQKVSAGIDWKPTDLLSVYFRYIYYNFDDKTATYNSGTAHMFLGGLSLLF
jgi:hypothetical protein